ncbi:PhzF family phenazine biosynthesis protein [Dokdonella sp. MW10]|uniref:PhzF family phenazine biosynthesis protein n=1 Tax=Dokdonella sp. MW10 TaxID=2992926 RepID=UPI003F7D7C23
MPPRPFLQLDVFTDRAGAGNALAVVLDGDGFDTATMQRFAAWTNLSETTFLLPSTDAGADYRVRIFTPRQELPFAGHPSVGSAFAALDAGLVVPRDGRLVQQCAAGLLPVRIDGEGASRRVHVRAPRASWRDADAAEREGLRIALAGADVGTPRLVDNGPLWWCVAMRDEAAVRGLVPDLAAMAAFTLGNAAVGVAVYAATGGDPAVVVRAFCPADGIPEDPVTGSANAAIGALLTADGVLADLGTPYRASQGREVGRDGVVEVGIDADGEVWIGGRCVVAIRGTLDW